MRTPHALEQEQTEDDFFLMANLSPLFTGLPFYVWISNRGGAQHDIRVKVSRGLKLKPDKLISVALRPDVHVVGDARLSSADMAALERWVRLNWDVLLEYWNGDIATDEAFGRLQSLTRTYP